MWEEHKDESRALVRGALEIRAQRLRGEVLFPQARREELDLQGRVGIDALEHMHQIDLRIDAVQTTGR